jgi:hypothetical protein
MHQPVVVKPAFQVRARVDPGRSMSLKVNKVAGLVAVSGVEEVLVTNLEQGGQRRVSGEVPPDARILLILAMHHSHGIPANKGFQPLFEFAVPGVGYFFMLGNGIQVGGGQRAGGGDAGFARPLAQCGNQLRALFMTLADHQVVESLYPLCYFFGKLRLNGKRDFSIHK